MKKLEYNLNAVRLQRPIFPQLFHVPRQPKVFRNLIALSNAQTRPRFTQVFQASPFGQSMRNLKNPVNINRPRHIEAQMRPRLNEFCHALPFGHFVRGMKNLNKCWAVSLIERKRIQ